MGYHVNLKTSIMKHLLLFVILGFVAISCNKTENKSLPLMKVTYPVSKKVDHTDTYFDSIVTGKQIGRAHV